MDIFLEYVTLKDIFEPVSKYTQYYACKEYVSCTGNEDNTKTKKILKTCKATDPGARHRLIFDKNRKWKFTPGLMIAWHGILIYHGGKAGEIESPRSYWRKMYHGTYTPFIQNTMSKHVSESCRRFIHLLENIKTEKG